jgi:ribose transport system substrate-binding protein
VSPIVPSYWWISNTVERELGKRIFEKILLTSIRAYTRIFCDNSYTRRQIMKRIVLIVFVLLVITSLLSAAPKKEEGKLIFAYLSGIEDPFMRMIEKGAQAKAEELGVEVMTAEYPKAWGPEIQVPILEALSARGGFDFLIVVPTSTEALIAPLKKIHDKGIPMITTDTFLGDGDYSKASNYSFPLAYIGTDNELGGYEVGKRLAEK